MIQTAEDANRLRKRPPVMALEEILTQIEKLAPDWTCTGVPKPDNQTIKELMDRGFKVSVGEESIFISW